MRSCEHSISSKQITEITIWSVDKVPMIGVHYQHPWQPDEQPMVRPSIHLVRLTMSFMRMCTIGFLNVCHALMSSYICIPERCIDFIQLEKLCSILSQPSLSGRADWDLQEAFKRSAINLSPCGFMSDLSHLIHAQLIFESGQQHVSKFVSHSSFRGQHL